VNARVDRLIRDERGSATLGGILFALILVVLAAAIVDVYRLEDLRTFAYGAANDAALVGVNLGRDWASFTDDGTLALDSTLAFDTARDSLVNRLAQRGLTNYIYQIEVLPAWSGNAPVFNFPPVARASLFCPAEPCTWTEKHPAVGVYVAVTAPTLLFGLINGNQPVVVHVFAAAEVIPQQ
jgi:hypothetical protein